MVDGALMMGREGAQSGEPDVEAAASQRDVRVTRTAQTMTPGGAESPVWPEPASHGPPPSSVTPSERTEHFPSQVDGAALGFALERERARLASEHSAAVRRLRRGLCIGLGVWVGSTLLDLYITELAGEGNLVLFMAAQCLVTVMGLIVLWRLYRLPEPSPRTLWFCDLVLFTTAAAVICIDSLAFRGINSPYAAGIIVVMLARGTTTLAPWQQGALLFGAPALTYPLTMGIASQFDPLIAAQLQEPTSLGTFFSMLYFLATSWLLLTFGGHFAWRQRREASETRNIGRYKLERRLGSGGMADVWAAFDVTLKLRVALKTVHGHRPGSSALVRFEREVRSLAELNHPNTVRVLDYGVTDDGLWYYAMELLQGENLRELVAREGPLEIERTVRIATQVLRALGEAHRKGIVHRDVKPENIFLAVLGGEVDVAKLLDFGIAKATVSSDMTLTSPGHVVGTPAYLAPEVILGHPADLRSDIYSFGATLYYLLSARLPFPDETTAAVFAAHMSREPTSLVSETPHAVPELIARVVQRCMAKNPAERYASTDDVLAALRAT
jgi:hypothetical protein